MGTMIGEMEMALSRAREEGDSWVPRDQPLRMAEPEKAFRRAPTAV